MEFNGKKILLNMVYYTVCALLLATGVTFMIFLALSDTRTILKVGYFILTTLFVLLMLFDIICTNLTHMKFVSGLVLYVLTIVTIVMAFIVYGTWSTRGMIAVDLVNMFSTLTSMSFILAILNIIIFCVGQKIVEYRTTK
jgi:hypothetical protein